MLIAVCALGVTGVVDSIEVMPMGLVAFTTGSVAFAWGGMVEDAGREGARTAPQQNASAEDMAGAHGFAA